MKGTEIRLSAFVLRTVDYAESDRIVTFFSREMGKVAAFARAARKSKKRFGGTLEPFHRLALSTRETRGDLLSLASAEIARGRGTISFDLDRLARASYLTELVLEATRERETHPELFDLADAAFDVLDGEAFGALARDRRDAWLIGVELGMLALAGWRPHLDGCAECGESRALRFRFVPSRGTLLCEAHADGHGFAVSGATAQALDAMLATPVADLGAFVLDEGALVEAKRLLVPFLHEALGKELKSARFLAEATS